MIHPETPLREVWCPPMKNATRAVHVIENYLPVNIGRQATVGDVLALSERDLFKRRFCGAGTLREIKKWLAANGMALRGDPLPTGATASPDKGRPLTDEEHGLVIALRHMLFVALQHLDPHAPASVYRDVRTFAREIKFDSGAVPWPDPNPPETPNAP